MSTILPTTAVAGGNGGPGGGGGYGGGGGGGAGGYGAVITGNGALGTLTVNVSGGAGGAGGGGVSAGFGGDGGIGLFFNSATATSLTIGSGVAVSGGGGGGGGASGLGGAGISGQNLTLTLAAGATVSGGGTGNAITFTGGSNTLSFNGLTAGLTGNIANGGTLLTFNQATDTTLASAITGSGAVTKQGAGILTLIGANSYTGLTTVSAGTLRAGAANAFSSASAVTLSGGTLDLNGFSQTIGSLSGSNGSAVTLGAATLSLGNNSAPVTYLGTITGGGSLNKIGSNALTLGAASTYSGGTTLTAGSVRAAATGALGSGTITFAGGTLIGAATGGATLTNALAFTGGTGTIANALSGDANALTLTAANSVFANTALHFGSAGNAGVVVFNPNGATGANRQLFVDVGTVRAGSTGLAGFTSVGTTTVAAGTTLDYAGFAGTIANLQGSGTITQDGGTLSVQSGSFAGSIKDGSASVGLAKTGSGTLSLSGTNTYTGTSTVSGGRVFASNTGSVFGTGGTATIGTGAVLELNVTGVNSIGQTAGTLTGAGQIQKTGTGNLYLGGSGTVNVSLLTGGLFDVQAGSVNGSSSNQGNWANNKGGLNIAAGATFDGVEGSIVVDALTGAGTLKGGYNGTKTTTIGIADGSGTFSGAITDSAAPLALTKAGAGTQILTGTNTYTGATTISGGTLQIGNGGTVGSIASTSALNLAGTLAFARSDTVALSLPVTGTGTLNQNGSGLLSLTTSNGVGAQFTGTANVNAGTLSVNGVFGDTAGNSATVNVNTNGTLHGAGTIAGSVVVANGGTVSAGNSPGTLAVNGNYTLNGGSTSLFELGAPGVVGGPDNDLIRVGGNLSVANTSNLALQTTGGSQVASGYYTLFDVTGTTTGRFGTVTNGGVTATSTVAQIVTNGGNGPSQYNVLLASNGQQVQFWDGAGLSANGTVDGGAGTWNATNTNWTIQSGAINDQWRSQAAVFGGSTGGTVTVAGTQSFQGLQFKTDGYVLSGGGVLTAVADSGISGATAASVTVDSGVATRIDNAIQGSAGLTKFGGGTLTLSGTSTYTGATTISAGTLALAGSGTLSTTTNLALATGATFDISALTSGGATIGGLTDTASGQAGVVVLGANRLTLGHAVGSFGGTIGGTGGLTLTSGTQTLAGTSGYTGSTLIDGGTLRAAVAGAFASGSAFNVAAGATLDLNGLDQTIGSLGGAGVVTLGAARLTTGGNNADTAYSGVISGDGGLTKLGTGLLTLSGVNTYTGGTTVQAGALAVASGGAVAGDVSNGATFTNAGGISGSLTNTGSATNTGTIGAGLTNSTGTYTQGAGATNGGTINSAAIVANGGAFGGAIANNAGATFTVGGTVTADSTFANAGTLTVNSGGSLSGVTVLTNDSTTAPFGLRVASGGTLSAGGVAGTAAGATLVSDGTLNLTGGVGDTIYAGQIAGAGTLTKSGSGVQIMTGANAASAQFTGTAVINGGTLRVDGAFGDTVSNTAQLTVGTGGTLAGSGTVAGSVVNNGTVAAGSGVGSVGHLTIGGSLTIAGGSTNAFDLGAPNVVGGVGNDVVTVGRDLTISGGTLALTNVAASGLYRLYDVGGTVSNAGQPNAGFTAVTATNGTAAAYAMPGQVNARVSLGGQIVQYWDGGDATGLHAGAQGGSGVWSAASTNWTDDPVGGQINQNWQGQFGVFSAPAAAGASTVTVDGQQTVQGLQFAGNGYTLAAGLNGSLNLTGDPGVTPSSSTIRVDAGMTATIDAPITGIGLNKAVGSGTLVLTGTNSFSALTISDGTVDVRNGAAIANMAPVTIADVAGARLVVTTSQTIGSLAGGGTTGSGVTVAAGQTLTTGGNDASTTFRGIIGGDGSLVKAGGGTFTLAGANAYAGPTTVSAGTLQAGAVNTFSSVSAVAIGANASLDLNGFDQTIASLSGAGRVTLGAGRLTAGGNNASTSYDGVISGAGGLTKLGTGTFSLTGANTYTGSTTVSAGTLSLASGASLSSAIVTLAGATLVNAGSLTGGVTNAGTVSNTGTVAGGLTNTGTVTVSSGRIDGSIANNAGTLTVSGSVASNGTFANAGGATLAITNSGAYGLTGLLTNAGSLTVASGGSLTAPGGIVNSGAITVAQGGRIVDALVNGGSVVNNGAYNADVTNTGTGTITSSAASVWTGNLIGNAGTLANAGQWKGDARNDVGGSVTNAGTWTTAGGTFTNAGNLVTNGVLNGGLANSGTVQAMGQINGAVANASGASFTLSGALSGVTTLTNDGMVDLGGHALTVASLSGTSTAAVLRNGTLVVNGASGATSYAGTIADGANPTSLVKSGSGTLTLTGNNTYTGGTTVQEGTLVATAANLGGGPVTNNTDFVIDQATASSVDSAINGAGRFAKRGQGTLTYAGTGTLTGATTVEAGALFVNGSLGSSVVGVAAGATLGGSGTVGGIVTNAAAAIAPGAGAGTVGTLNVSGNVSFAGQSIYQVDATAAGQSDRITATGTARLEGGTVAVTAQSGSYSASTRYTILTAAGGVSGQFANVTSNFAFLVPSLTYDANDAYLTLVRNSLDFASVATTRNQASIAGAVEATGMGSRLFNTVGVLSVPQARTAFDALSGEIQSSAVSAQFATAHLVREAVLDRLRFGDLPSFSGLGAEGIGQRFAPGTTLPALYTADLPGRDTADLPGRATAPTPVTAQLVDPNPVSVWGQGFGAFGSVGGDGNAARLDQQTSGFVIGADTRLGGTWRVGLAGGYTFTTLDVAARQSRGTIESGFGALYAGAGFGPVQLRLGASYAGSSLTTSRAVIFPGFSETDSARYGGSIAQAFGELGYRIGSAEGYLEPFVGGAAIRISRDGFTERGGVAALSTNGQDYDIATATVGVQAQAQLGDLFGTSTPILARGLVGYRRAYGDLVPSTLFTFAGTSQAFLTAGVPVAHDALVAQAGLDWQVTPATTLSISYTGQIGGDRTQVHGVKGGFVYRW